MPPNSSARRRLSPAVVVVCLVLLMSACAPEVGTVATDTAQQEQAAQHALAKKERQQQRRRQREARERRAARTPASPPPTTVPPGSAEDYWAQVDASQTEIERTINGALAHGALLYDVARFTNPAGDLYCNLTVAGFAPACELSSSGNVDPDWCRGRPARIVGRIEFVGYLPVPVCNSDTIRRPGALVVPAGGVADSSVLRCLVEEHGVVCEHRRNSNGFTLHRMGYGLSATTTTTSTPGT